MRAIETDLLYKTAGPGDRPAGKSPTIILLHGRGADENDLLGLSQFFDPRFLVFSLRAPFPFEYGGYTYFTLNEDGTADTDMYLESFNRVMKFVDGVRALSEVDPAKLFLVGFSMGTIMSYALSLAHPEKFAGVAAQSGFVRDHPALAWKWDQLKGCDFIITHGVNDPVIPLTLARETKGRFDRSNAQFVYKEYPMGHEISDESLADVSGWLKKKIDREGQR
ncbi:MAG TPA: alpha/beta fold hydrolase [Bacteroidota bacterium]|nr:alpha/beta fold hydrolase [Bacteroidota bacterium]